MVSVAHNLGPVFLLGFQVSAMSWPLCKSIPLKNTEISGGTWMSLSSKKKEIENNQTFYTEKGFHPNTQMEVKICEESAVYLALEKLPLFQVEGME